MAIGLPFHDQPWSPADALPEATPTADRGPDVGLSARTEGVLDLGLVRAVIEEGLLMVFGPDGDPIPPQAFCTAAAEQPEAGIRFRDGPQIDAERIAAVLDAQMSGRLGSGRTGDDAWIETMLGIGPRPEMAAEEELLAEDCTVEVIAFGKELLITTPTGATFLLTEARSRTPDSVGLRLANEGAIAVGDLVARLVAGTGERLADDRPSNQDEFAADCQAWIEDDTLVVDLPKAGAVYLAQSIDHTSSGALASVFMSSGETATIDDLMRALSRPTDTPPASGHEPSMAPCDLEPEPHHSLPLTLDLPEALAAEPDRVALVVIRGLPEGAGLSAGVESGDGSWLLSPQDLAALSLALPARPTADFPIDVMAIAVADREGELISDSKTVLVPPQSDVVEHGPAPIPLGLDPQALSENGPFDAIIVLDVPVGATLSAGTYDPAIDAWVLLPRQLSELSVTPASGDSEDFLLSLLGVGLQPGARARPRVLGQVEVIVR